MKRLIRKLGPIRRRDETIARLRSQLSAKDAVGDSYGAQHHDPNKPSFSCKYAESKRLLSLVRAEGTRDPLWAVNPKDEGYSFARSHALHVPTVFQRCSNPVEIAWAALPDEFVIKTVNGTSARGVFPLVRQTKTTFTDLLNVQGVPMEPSDVVDALHSKRGRVSAELVVEELLRSPYSDGGQLALDVKLYCFYGQVGMVMMRDPNGSRDQAGIRVRYFDPSGNDLGRAMLHRQVDSTLPAPLHLDELIDAGARLSRALMLPFVRLDFFEQVDRVVFGEVSATPGGAQQPRPDVDAHLGDLWEAAEARLRADLNQAGSFAVHYGDARAADQTAA